MQLTVGQVRDAIGLTQDAYRHWRTVIPQLSSKVGRNSRFSSGDLLALAIIKALTDDLSISVGSLDKVSAAIFEICNSQSWTRIERLVISINVARQKVSLTDIVQITANGEPNLVLPCGSIVSSLRDVLLTDKEPEPQAELRFPLSAIGSDRRNERS